MVSHSLAADCSSDSTESLVSPLISCAPIELSRRIRLGFMASGSGTNFAAVAQAVSEGKLDADIPVLIYNNPGAKVVQRAQKWDVPAVLLNHRNYPSREDLDRAIIEVLHSHNVDLVIMAGWMRIVTQVLLDAFPERVINIHPSLLPSFKGIKAIEQALQAKVKITGCTVHLASLEVDSGRIIQQAAVPVGENDTPESLHARIQQQEHKILPTAIALVARQYLGI